MSYHGFEYVSVEQKKAKALRAKEKLRKKQPDIEPIVVTGNSRKLTKTWWGTAWADNLERYADFSNRIDRGRSYVRHGCVLDLRIEPGLVHAQVQGSGRSAYKIQIKIEPLDCVSWQAVKHACEGKIESLGVLLEGKFPRELEQLFKAEGTGLFPSPKEIKFGCSCPDGAWMCKHIAAVLYGVGIRLDEQPELFFTLRAAQMEDLLTKVIEQKRKAMLGGRGMRSERILADADLGALFNLDMDEIGKTMREDKFL